ncbi:MAG TPA: M15 family metallopeptidase [Candidatus Paceibacterota bacterium]
MERRNILRIAKFTDLLMVDTIESGEKMVNLSKTMKNCVCVYQNHEMAPYVGEDLWVRESVAVKLQFIANSIHEFRPTWRLKITYGYKHPEVQQLIFERRKEELRVKIKNVSEPFLIELTNKITAYPETAGHPTGGAIDVTITTPDGDLDMGTKVSDCSDTKKIRTYDESLTTEQEDNRKILHFYMVAQDFAPYYGEWWHFSYGDKEWAFFWNYPNAIYGQLDFRTV